MIRQIADSLLATLYPQACFVCGDIVESYLDGVACTKCWSETQIYDGTECLCSKCGALLDPARGAASGSCPNCLEAEYDGAFAVGIYEKALAATIVNLKKVPYLPRRARDLFAILSQKIGKVERSVVLPVPLSRSRSLERGYNQAAVLAQVLAKAAGLPVNSTCLIRRKHTQMHRIAMDRKARQMTVEKAFEVRSPRLVDGQDVILVDDVFTSGATASACASALKKNGARRITVVTLARATLYR